MYVPNGTEGYVPNGTEGYIPNGTEVIHRVYTA